MSKLTDELLSEKSLWDIWRKSVFLTIDSQAFSANSLLLVISAAFVTLFVRTWDANISVILDAIRTILTAGISYSITMLGFLLAGFSIMAGITRPDLWLKMAEIDKRPGVSYLKYNFFVYMKVFIFHVIYLAAFFLAQLFVFPGNFVLKLIDAWSADPARLKVLVAKSAVVALFCCLVHLIIQLKYFIFNVYHSVMTSLAWEAEKAEAQKPPSIQ